VNNGIEERAECNISVDKVNYLSSAKLSLLTGTYVLTVNVVIFRLPLRGLVIPLPHLKCKFTFVLPWCKQGQSHLLHVFGIKC
jgi:hypothetical protein